LVRVARARGCHVLLHVLDCSKTGLSAVSRACAARLMRENSGALTVVVDACQLRGAPQKVRADLEAGFLVMVSGSKFAGGPAFSGALLAPRRIVAALIQKQIIPWPEGLADHFALFDWPPSLRDLIAGPFGARCNTGLALRWEAALADYEAYCALDPLLIARAVACFNGEARRQIAALPDLEIDESGGDPTLLPIVRRKAGKGDVKTGDADAMLRALRKKGLFLGQTVAMGPREALRLCLSAPQIVDFARRYREMGSEAFAFAPLRSDLEKLFDGWASSATVEGAPGSAVRNAAHACGFAAITVDPGEGPGAMPRMNVIYYDYYDVTGRVATARDASAARGFVARRIN
jgi:hypothetical protein